MEKCKKLHFQCTDFNSSTHVTVYTEHIGVFMKILTSLLNVMLNVDKYCSDVCCHEFPVPHTDCKSKQLTEHSDTENFICNQYGENSLS